MLQEIYLAEKMHEVREMELRSHLRERALYQARAARSQDMAQLLRRFGRAGANLVGMCWQSARRPMYRTHAPYKNGFYR